MAVRSSLPEDDGAEERPVARVAVSALQASPGRTVFIESGNTDGWIATDHAVELSP